MKKILVFLSVLLLGVLSSCFLKYEDPLGDGVKIDNLTQVDFTDSLKKNGPLTTNNLPSTGDVNVLVVPISFDPLIDKEFRPNIIPDIEKAFNGTKDINGYYGVSEFYKLSSYGKLNLKFDVLDDYYKPKNSTKYYASYGDGMGDGSTVLFKEVIEYYDKTMDLSKYDSDLDGYIDSVWMVYTNPVDFKYGRFWWAYVTNSEIETNDGVKGLYYGFAGIDFLYPANNQNETYDTTGIKIDAHTFIHETGHLFGLDDYYDYDYDESPLYGLDYMDLNYGDHGPISKLLLDWVNPIIVNDVCEITINPYQKNGEVYLFTNNFHNTIYDSYYLIINYSNEGLYKTNPYFDDTGILVYKVNAQLNKNSSGEIVMNGGNYPTAFMYDNTDTSLRFVEYVPAKVTGKEGPDLLFKTNDIINFSDMNLSVKINVISNTNQIGVSVKRNS